MGLLGVMGRLHLEWDGKEVHVEDEGPERGRGEGIEPAAAASRPEEADADPEEAPEQHEVREVGEVEDLRPEPADERELGEQHHEREGHQAGTGGEDAAVVGPGHRRRGFDLDVGSRVGHDLPRVVADRFWPWAPASSPVDAAERRRG
jgi:hypothetical protein